MKSLLIIYGVLVVTLVGGVIWANGAVNGLMSAVEWQAAYSEPVSVTEPLSVVDTGYNSASDVLQTVSGINVYQNAPNLVQQFLSI